VRTAAGESSDADKRASRACLWCRGPHFDNAHLLLLKYGSGDEGIAYTLLRVPDGHPNRTRRGSFFSGPATQNVSRGSHIRFTFYWRDTEKWEGMDFAVTVGASESNDTTVAAETPNGPFSLSAVVE
jgi:hypothetical protein